MRFQTMKQVKNYVYETYSGGRSCLFQIVYVKTTIEGFEHKKRTVLAKVTKRQNKARSDKRKENVETHKNHKKNMRDSRKRMHENNKGTDLHEMHKK